MTHTVLLFYKFANISNPQQVLISQQNLCKSLGLKGRIIISGEGINGTLEGLSADCGEYIRQMHQIDVFGDIVFKQSVGSGSCFPRLSIKVREEIVTTNLPYTKELGPHCGFTGKYLSPEELNQWYGDGREFYMVDMRNDYEYNIGHFKGSVLLKNLKNFRNLPDILPELEHLKGKTIVTCCTGGVRCEKASAFLMYNYFKEVYQLEGGIATYIKKYPNRDFLGKLYVFDGRLSLGIDTGSPDHTIVGKCSICGVQSENITDYWYLSKRHHGVVCSNCVLRGDVKLTKDIVNPEPIKC